MELIQKIKQFLGHPKVAAIKPVLSVVCVLVVSVLAIWVIVRDFQKLSLTQILHTIQSLPHAALFMGCGLTVVSYLLLIFYDWMGALYADVCASWKQTAVASFCSYVISHNLGCPAVTGAAVRYRLYRSWGAGRTQIGSIIGFCSLTFLIGILGLATLVTLSQPHLFARLAHIPVTMMYLVSASCIVLLVLYTILCRAGISLNFGRNKVCLPKWELAVGQLMFGMTEMACTAGILWAFLGNTHFSSASGLNFLGFLGIYLAGYFAGVTGGTPGGLGIFDGFILVALAPFFSVAHIFGGLILFRLAYSFVPFVFASLLFCGHEVHLCRKDGSQFSVTSFFKKQKEIDIDVED